MYKTNHETLFEELNGPFCSISDETTSYELKSQQSISGGTFIYDYDTFGDFIFLITGTTDLFCIKVQPPVNG